MNDIAYQILSAAFEDELEKIAGLPRAVREGGGGQLGATLRRANQSGSRARPKIREFRETLEAPGFWGKEPLLRKQREAADRLVREGKSEKAFANSKMRVSTKYPHDAFEQRRTQSPELFQRLQEARKKKGLPRLK